MLLLRHLVILLCHWLLVLTAALLLGRLLTPQTDQTRPPLQWMTAAKSGLLLVHLSACQGAMSLIGCGSCQVLSRRVRLYILKSLLQPCHTSAVRQRATDLGWQNFHPKPGAKALQAASGQALLPSAAENTHKLDQGTELPKKNDEGWSQRAEAHLLPHPL